MLGEFRVLGSPLSHFSRTGWEQILDILCFLWNEGVPAFRL